MNLLTLLLVLPATGFLIALLIPRSSAHGSRSWALLISLVTFVVSLALPVVFDRNTAGEQLALNVPWITTPDIHYYVAVDGIGLWLVLLSTFLTPICVLISCATSRIARRNFTLSCCFWKPG